VRARPASHTVTKGLLASLALCISLSPDGHAQPRDVDVVAALERIRDTGIFPEYLSLEYVDLQRAVAEIVEREPYGYVADLASRVLTRVVVNLRQPLLSEDDQPYLEADLLGPPNIGHPNAELQGSIDGGPWKVLTQLGKGQLGRIICDALGNTACAPGWHALALRAIVSGPSGPGGQPRWVETRELPLQTYGIFRKSEPERAPVSLSDVATPAAWVRAVLEAPASLIDAQLPPNPLPLWLASTLRAAGQPELAQSLRWETGHCGVDMVERFRDRSRAPTCVIFDAGYRDLSLHLEFSLGPLVGETGRTPWPATPAFQGGHLEDNRGSLDIPSLPHLAAAFAWPRKAWPTADLRVWPIDILYSPLVPNPGDAVNVEFTVHNQGRQDARALIVFWLAAAEVDEERVEFIADVPAGRHYRFTRSIRLPLGSGTGFAGVQAQLAPPRGSLKRVEEANQDNNDVTRLLGAMRPAVARD
jgi:hypothetical protein